MWSPFDDLATFQNNDFVTIPNRAETVCYNQAPAATAEEVFFNFLFSWWIKGTGGLIQDDETGLTD
jgi:hypothetical protein